MPEIKMRQLTPGLKVSSLGLGCMGMVDFYGSSNITEATRILDAAYECGINFFDTADVYANGIGEELIGRVLKNNYRDIILATKCGFIKSGDAATTLQIDASAKHIKKACDESLKRLGAEVIDLYLLHRGDPNVPVEESIGAMADLVRAGKVRFIGVCAVDITTLQRAQKIHPIAVLQDEYSLFHREPENDLLSYCKEQNIGFVPYSPLCRGLLTGAITLEDRFENGDVRQYLPRFEKNNLNKNLALVDQLRDMASEKKCTVSQLALAWLLAQQNFIVPIPGPKTIAELEENVGAATLKLSFQEVERIGNIFPHGCVSGSQYPDLLNASKKHHQPESK